jgi:hypothetical protein
MPSLSYSELVGLLIAGALVLFPLTQPEPASGTASARPIATLSSPNGSDTGAQFMCPRPGPLKSGGDRTGAGLGGPRGRNGADPDLD